MDAAPQTRATQPARPRRRWLRFSLRTLLVVVTLVAVAVAYWVNGAQRQRRAVAAIQAVGGEVGYDYTDVTKPAVDGKLPGPDWLCALLGVDYFDDVTYVVVPQSAGDETVTLLSGLTHLEILHLSETQITDASMAHLAGLTHLEVLHLNGTRVTNAGLVHLRGLRRLWVLSLDNTGVDDAGLSHLGDLPELFELDLTGTKVTDAGLPHVSRLTTVVSLRLDGTQVSDAGLDHLQDLTSLQMLTLYNTQVTDAGCARLQQALPNCRIMH
jgi:hypothetical protein